MKAAFSLAVLLLLSSAASNFADTVELNGITSLFGEKLAFMVLHRADRREPLSFILSEGQSQFGVKLLAVDISNCRVQIAQSGEIQSVRLGSAPTMALATILPATLAEDAGQYPVPRHLTTQEQTQVQNFLNGDGDVGKIRSDNPIYLGAALPASPNSTKADAAPVNNAAGGSDGTIANNGLADSGAAQPPAISSSDSAGGNSGSSPVDYTKQYWYVTSLGIERNRLVTANQVLEGAMEPLPRTPLTPPGTPPALVGPETFFPNQIPGFAYGGSVD